MSRAARNAPGGQIDPVLNRSVGRINVFRNDPDHEALQRVVVEAQRRHPIRLLSYCAFNHWTCATTNSSECCRQVRFITTSL